MAQADLRFEDRLQQAVAQASRTGEKLALHVVAAREAGRSGPWRGAAFPAAGHRIASLIRECDAATYLGDGLFAVLQRAVPGRQGAASLARKLIGAVEAGSEATDRRLEATVGVTLHEQGVDARELFDQARTALDTARGEDAAFRFHPTPGAEPSMQRVGRIERACRENELFLRFQPQVLPETGKPLALEALLRWRRPDGSTEAEPSVEGPLAILSIAESSGEIHLLGEWILGEACRQCSRWNRARSESAVPVAVNVSAVQLGDPRLVDRIRRVLDCTGLPAELLELELTETTALGDLGRAKEVLDQVRKLGVRVALDDFGTGYSSLLFLSALPVDKIKIPRELVVHLLSHDKDHVVFRAVTGLARQLGLTIVAEGIETPEQARAVQELGCEALQGFLFGKPCDDPRLALSRSFADRFDQGPLQSPER